MTSRIQRVTRLALVGALTLLPASHAAATSHDQGVDPEGVAVAHVDQEAVAQTFTAGTDGMLTSIHLHLARNNTTSPSDLLVQVRSTTSGTPADVVLDSTVVPAAGVPTEAGWVEVPVSAPSAAGSQYAIVLTAPDAPAACAPVDCGYNWGLAYQQYSGGAIWFGTTTEGPWGTFTGYDAAFRTFVGGGEVAPTIVGLQENLSALSLSNGDLNRLMAKLNGAQRAVDHGNLTLACKKLDAFAGDVAGDTDITTSDADALIADTAAVQSDLGCGATGTG